MTAVDTSLKNKVALVTGGSKGIGRAIALAFARAGARVVVAARGAESLDAAKQEIEQYGNGCLALPADLSSDDQVRRLHEIIANELGSIDILVNNAGMAHIVELSKITREQFDEVLSLNTWAALHLSQLCYPAMKEKGQGVILNIASNGGVKPDIFAGAYSASKAAMIILTKQMACEWGGTASDVRPYAPGLSAPNWRPIWWLSVKRTGSQIWSTVRESPKRSLPWPSCWPVRQAGTARAGSI